MNLSARQHISSDAREYSEENIKTSVEDALQAMSEDYPSFVGALWIPNCE